MIAVTALRAIETASVTGIFAPEAMAASAGLAGAAPRHREALWRVLSEAVTEVLPEGGGYGWVLRPDPRGVALRQFLTRAQLDRALAEAPPLWPEDDFGHMLRLILSGREVAFGSGRAAEDGAALLAQQRQAAAALDAAQFAVLVPAIDRDRVLALERRAKQAIQVLQRRRDLTIVLPRRHRGYEDVRRLLSAHLTGAGDDPRPILLTGLGGAGKSALLAQVLRPWQTRRTAPVTVILDFDRRQLNAGEPVEIVREILRQLETGLVGKLDGDAETTVLGGLRDMRRVLPKLTASRDQRTHASQMGYLMTDTLRRLSGDWARALHQRPIALVLDSFEAVDRRGGAVVQNILDLERFLREAGLRGLRSVVSGRAEPLAPELLANYFGWPERGIVLTGLQPVSGGKLLADEDARLSPSGVPVIGAGPLYRQASAALNGHPLSLLIFARYAHGSPLDAESLVREIGEDETFQAAFAQRFLYERTLERIDEPDLNALAHPGLVLRELDADLVRLVLAGPCLGRGPADPDPMTAAEAEDILHRLSEKYWLVDAADPPFALRHRPDLRRLMLPALFAPADPGQSAARQAQHSDLRARALEVCRLAASHFRDGPADPAARARWDQFDPGLRLAHALYYEAFLTPTEVPEIDQDTALALDLHLDQDVETLPLAWRALVKARLVRPLSEAERSSLPDEMKQTIAARDFTEAAKVGLEPRAKVATRADPVPGGSRPARRSGPRTASADDPDACERAILAAFATADFAAAAETGPRYLRALATRSRDETEARFRRGEKDGYWRHALWKLILLAGAGRTEGALTGELPPGGESAAAYRPLDHALAAAERRDADAVRSALAPVFQRDLLSPVDRNRIRSAAGATDGPVAFLPSALGLAAGAPSEEPPRNDDLMPFLMSPETSAREVLLSDIAHLYSTAIGARPIMVLPAQLADGPRALHRVLRGLNPDLQEPLTALLATLPPVEAMRRSAALSEVARNWPRELRFVDGAVYRSAQAATVVETADQCGVLRDLAAGLLEARPEAATVVSMFDWITALFFPYAADPDAEEPDNAHS